MLGGSVNLILEGLGKHMIGGGVNLMLREMG